MSSTPIDIQPYPHARVIWSQFDSHHAYVIQPTTLVDPQRRWVWFTSCWHAVGNVIDTSPVQQSIITHRHYVTALLDSGFHVAGIDVGVTLGSPAGAEICRRFYQHVITAHNLNPRARTVFQSNGALIMYNWAAQHPDCVSHMLGIFPAVDLRSWPGLDRVCTGDVITYPEFRYPFSQSELESRLHDFNPIDRLRPLAAHHVKLFHVHGDADELVPIDQHSIPLQHRYQQLGGEIEIEIISGGVHADSADYYESNRARDFLLSD